jgi:predicted nucleic-acid-binding Zn-ribbon protein
MSSFQNKWFLVKGSDFMSKETFSVKHNEFLSKEMITCQETEIYISNGSDNIKCIEVE